MKKTNSPLKAKTPVTRGFAEQTAQYDICIVPESIPHFNYEGEA